MIDEKDEGTMPKKPETIKTKPAKSKDGEARLVTSLGAGEDFISTGFTRDLKVTRKGKEERFRLQITTKGLRDLFDEWAQNAPRPKTKTRLSEKEESVRAGIPRGSVIYYEDRNDPKHMAELDAHIRERQYAMLGTSVDLELKNAEGKIVTDPVERGKELFDRLGSTHFTQILDDITDLDRITQEQEDFLSGETSA